jgi:DNA-binding transcriptional LysR family regulator
VELRHLRYFVMLAETLHFARAAERLDIAAPTLTVQIQDLERSLGAQLFARGRRQVALTGAGEVFLVEARAVLARAEQAERAGRRAGRGEVGRVALGYVASAVYGSVMQEQLGRFRTAWPNVQVTAREVPMSELPGLLTHGQLDLGFVRLPLRVPPGQRAHVLFEDVFCMALPGDHRLAAGHTIRPRDLADADFITPEQVAGTHEVARRGGFMARIVASPGSLIAVLMQVSLGAGVAVVPSVLTATVRIPNVVFRPFAGEPITSEVAMIFRSREAAPATQKLIAQFRAVSSRRLTPDWGDSSAPSAVSQRR